MHAKCKVKFLSYLLSFYFSRGYNLFLHLRSELSYPDPYSHDMDSKTWIFIKMIWIQKLILAEIVSLSFQVSFNSFLSQYTFLQHPSILS